MKKSWKNHEKIMKKSRQIPSWWRSSWPKPPHSGTRSRTWTHTRFWSWYEHRHAKQSQKTREAEVAKLCQHDKKLQKTREAEIAEIDQNGLKISSFFSRSSPHGWAQLLVKATKTRRNLTKPSPVHVLLLFALRDVSQANQPRNRRFESLFLKLF